MRLSRAMLAVPRAAAALLAAALASPLLRAQPAAAALEAARFDILEFHIDGNSLLPAEAVERAVMPHMGEGRTLRDAENARAALERRYHEAGWQTVLVTIPEQEVAD